MPVWPEFTGPSYESRSRTVAGDATFNLFTEAVESGTGKAKYCLYGRPGSTQFADTAAAGGGQGILEVQGRAFAVANGRLYEVFSDATVNDIGTVGTTDTVSMAANSTQLIVVSAAGGGWILPLNDSAAYAQITSAGFPVGSDSVTYQDTYFIATRNGTQEFFISAPGDGTSWDPLDFASKEGNPDFVLAVQMVRRQLWVLGTDTSEIWWNSGQPNFPFQPIQGALVQTGAAAIRTPTIVGNGMFWLGKNSRGKAVAFAEQNFVPIRVSNHAVENEWNGYSTISDAIGYGLELNGHTFNVISFPTAGKTWVLDTKSGFWHQWDWWNTDLGAGEAALARFHCFCFDQHLVLDWKLGNVHTQSLDAYTDSGGVIRRMRRSPHVDQAKHRDRHVRFEMDMEVGTVPVEGNGSDPVYSLRFSDDGGFTWSNELIRYIGKTGKYANQVVWRQLGSSRDRVYELVSTEPIPHAWAAAYLEIAPSTERQ